MKIARFPKINLNIWDIPKYSVKGLRDENTNYVRVRLYAYVQARIGNALQLAMFTTRIFVRFRKNVRVCSRRFPPSRDGCFHELVLRPRASIRCIETLVFIFSRKWYSYLCFAPAQNVRLKLLRKLCWNFATHLGRFSSHSDHFCPSGNVGTEQISIRTFTNCYNVQSDGRRIT